ncbi:MAG: N-acetyltransferase [Candidatus Sericytochromatia bacterium]|nr:MAG: N-acetyltransferase [Candidatus Sericytochromatia bacterium]
MINIRNATIEDVDIIIFFIKELAFYEKEAESVILKREDIIKYGFGDTPIFKVLIAEYFNNPVGFAFYFFTYSTWLGKPVLHLEDLFILPEYRKKGIAKKLMKELAKIAIDNDCCRFQWQVLDWNQLAINFYNSLNAKPLKEWITYRLDRQGLLELAKSNF